MFAVGDMQNTIKVSGYRANPKAKSGCLCLTSLRARVKGFLPSTVTPGGGLVSSLSVLRLYNS